MKPKIQKKKFFELSFVLIAIVVLASDCRCGDDSTNIVASLFKESKGHKSFGLLYTANMQGWVEPCGCTSEPLGGIARLATVALAARDHFALGTSLVDGGNLLFGTRDQIHDADVCQQEARAQLLVNTFSELKALGTFDGEFDNAMGEAFRDNVYNKSNLNNLRLSAREGVITGETEFKVGIFFIDEKTKEVSSVSKRLLGKGAKAIVAFSFLSKTQTNLIQDLSNSVNVVILAADQSDAPPLAEQTMNGPVFVSVGRLGQYVGIVEFHVDIQDVSPSGWIFDSRQQEKESRMALVEERKNALLKEMAVTSDLKTKEYLKERVIESQTQLEAMVKATEFEPLKGNFIVAKTIALSRKIPSHPKFAAWLSEYEMNIPLFVESCEAGLECPTVAQGEPKYVGAETCKACHAVAYDFWKKSVIEVKASDERGNPIFVKSGHSKAFATLEEKAKTLDRTCIGCHSVGFMEPGGYCKVKEVNKFKDVQCESCHGPGSNHAQTANPQLIQRRVPESVCRSCHHVPHIPSEESFVYKERLEHILGVGHGEMFLNKLKHEIPQNLSKNMD